MVKFKQGSVTNPTTGKTTDIVVKSASPNTVRDTLIGGGMVMMGIAYLTIAAFKNGSTKFEEAEMKALSDSGLID